MTRSDLMRPAAATMRAWPRLALLLACVVPVAALAVTEPDTGTEYPDTIGLDLGGETVTLRATGVGLREKTFFKVDVYTIVSYVVDDAQLGERPARTLCTIDAPKRIRMDLRRGFSRDKLVDSFRESIEKNMDDLSSIEAAMAAFEGYFDRDAREGDEIVFTYLPGRGVATELNGARLGVIDEPAFAVALWSVWFGDEPTDEGLRDDLLKAI